MKKEGDKANHYQKWSSLKRIPTLPPFQRRMSRPRCALGTDFLIRGFRRRPSARRCTTTHSVPLETPLSRLPTSPPIPTLPFTILYLVGLKDFRHFNVDMSILWASLTFQSRARSDRSIVVCTHKGGMR